MTHLEQRESGRRPKGQADAIPADLQHAVAGLQGAGGERAGVVPEE